MRVSSRQRQFDALVRAHNGDLYRYAYWLCGDSSLAQDLAQETFLRAWRSLDTLRDTAAAKAWLITILRREHARLYERKQFDTTDISELELDDREALTPEQVNAAARTLDANTLTWVVVGDLSKIEAGIRALDIGPVQVIDADGKPVAPAK